MTTTAPRVLLVPPVGIDRAAWTDAGVELVDDDATGTTDLSGLAAVVIDGGLSDDAVAEWGDRLAGLPAPPPAVIAVSSAVSSAVSGAVAARADAILSPDQQAQPAVVAFALEQAARMAALRARWQSGQRELDRIALEDPLTGLGNRQAFLRELERHVSVASRNDSGFVLLMMDVDGLAAVQDQHGPHGRDSVMQTYGHRLAGILRGADVAFRATDKGFAALMTTGVNSYGVETVARRVIREIALPVVLNDAPVEVGISIGIGFCPEHGQDAGTLLRRIDEALQQAKTRETGFAVAEVD